MQGLGTSLERSSSVVPSVLTSVLLQGALVLHIVRAAVYPLCSLGGIKSCHFTPAWWPVCPTWGWMPCCLALKEAGSEGILPTELEQRAMTQTWSFLFLLRPASDAWQLLWKLKGQKGLGVAVFPRSLSSEELVLWARGASWSCLENSGKWQNFPELLAGARQEHMGLTCMGCFCLLE